MAVGPAVAVMAVVVVVAAVAMARQVVVRGTRDREQRARDRKAAFRAGLKMAVENRSARVEAKARRAQAGRMSMSMRLSCTFLS